MISRRTSYIDGVWVAAPADADSFAVVDPTTEQTLATISFATAAQADAAVDAAVRDQPAWGASAPGDRVRLVERMAELLRERSDELTELITAEVGMPSAQARVQQVGAAIAAFEDAAVFLPEALEPETLGNTIVVAEPVGVVVAITPWNFPLYQAALKVAPALAAGCTVVLKPSEVTPLSALALAEVFDQARTELMVEGIVVPSGVFSVALGGAAVGDRLVRDARVDLVSLTGSTAAGRAVAASAAHAVTRVSLELGGKSPLVVLDDADLDAAVRYGVSRCYINGGQTCAALTRLIVPRRSLADAERVATDAVGELTVGDPREQGTRIGPLVSSVQRDRVRAYIEQGIADGATLVAGGPEPLTDRGWFVRPTVFSDTTPDMTIVREEIFGPVLVIQPYDSLDEAVHLANDTEYGLAAGVFGEDAAAAADVARRLRAGTVFVGAAAPNPQAPFGGVKGSGYGRERGPHGLREFLTTKSLIGAAEGAA